MKSWDRKYAESRPQRHADLLFLNFFYRQYLDKRNISSKEKPKALILGCGQGVEAFEIATNGFTVHATDTSPTAIEYVQSKTKSSSLKSFASQILDQRKLDQLSDPGPYDIIVSWSVISYITRREAVDVLAGLSKLLRDQESRLLILFENIDSSAPHQTGAIRVEGNTYQMPSVSRVQDDVQMTFYSSDESEALLLQSGFKVSAKSHRSLSLPPTSDFEVVQDIYLCALAD